MKMKLALPFLFATLIFSNQSFAALNGGNSSLASESAGKSFSESSVGAGLSAGVRFNLAEDIFSDSEDEISACRDKDFCDETKKITQNSGVKDHIFTEIEIFGNQFFSGEVKQNFGGRLNLGYEIYGVRIYGSGGYVASTVDYQEQSGESESIMASAPFFGGGLGYDINKNIAIRLDSMFYNFDFAPKNSGFKNVKVDVAAVAVGLALHF
jgi:opacity protein-like surface antigen